MRTTRATVTTAAIAVLAVFFAGLAAAAPQSQRSSTRPPNILLIISDDIGMDVTTNMYPGLVDDLVKKYGPEGLNHPNYQAIKGRPASTPALDQIARQGMVFTNAWAQPFCSPTRASILTGLFSVKTKVLTYQDPLSAKHTSFIQQLKNEAGYAAGIFGKWHMAGLTGNPSYPGMKPKQAGFDVFRGNMHAAIRTYWNYEYQVQDGQSEPNQWRVEPAPRKSLPGVAPTTYAPVVNAADAIEWITAQEKADPNKPWFVWLAFNLAHATSQQQPSAMAVPEEATMDDVSRKEIEACGGTYGTANTGRCSGETLMRAMTNSMDTIMGKVIAAVDALDPNTYVIYIGDNGTPMYGRPNLDFIDNMYLTKKNRGKGTTYESGTRVPLAIRGPGIAPASRNGEFVHAVDLFSTGLELAGLKPPKTVANSDGTGTETVDSVSLAPILFNKAGTARDPNEGYLLTETINLMTNSSREVGARNRDYKVVCKQDASNCEFFNVAKDPLEEFPLPKPADCARAGASTPADPAWHFCRLTDVVKTKSFYKNPR
jgi:arylsulfatase A-like enzyme